MSLPDADVNFLLENLRQVITYKYHLIADVRDNIEKLQQELEKLKALMKDYEKYNHDSDYFKEMAHQIRDVLYEAEDAVDTFLLNAAARNARGWVVKTFHKFTDYPKTLRDLGKQIEGIGEKVKKINEEKGNLVRHLTMIELGQAPKPKEVPEVEEDHVVGFEKAAEEVSQLLVEGPMQFEIISIVGMLGIGKTTLAKKVFKDPDVDYEFMIRVFVHVSEGYEKRKVLLNILNSFRQIRDEVYEMTDKQLEEHIHEQLKGKNYLIVLDGVGDTKDWDRFKDAFPRNNKRCRVLITTRNKEVVEYAKSRPYELGPLPRDKSRELLSWRVFRQNNCPKDVEEYEIQIVEECDRLPLAIVVIAGILVNHSDSVDWWKNVANNVKEYIARDDRQTTKVFKLMYKYLPNYLKPCFLYLGVFGEDHEIPVWKLVRLWIAEGLIREERNLNLEDIAEQYLEELVYRNLVMVGQRRATGKIKTCFLQSTVRQFCKYEAMEENLFQEIKEDKLSFFLSRNPTLDRYRRLCINYVNILDYISGGPSGQRVRSFLTFLREETTIEPKLVSFIPKTFRLLRVLEAQSLLFTRFPADLCNLVLLKYIAISSHFRSLPFALRALWNMQTLIVNTTSNTLEIKADIWKMPQFRHLHTNASTILPCLDANIQHEGWTSKNIRTLSTISPESCQAEVFQRTSKLTKLGIRGRLSKLFEFNVGESCLFDNIGKLYSLENLKLVNDKESLRLHGLCSVESFPPQLKELTLSNTQLDWKEMDMLGKLENLEVLKLKDNAFQGELWHTENGGFCCLKYLHIGSTDLVVWEASADDFPKLESLQLNSCNKLQAVPRGLADISSLQLLVLHCTNPQVASSARKLQVLKLEQTRKGNRTDMFKLSIYPPEH